MVKLGKNISAKEEYPVEKLFEVFGDIFGAFFMSILHILGLY